MEGISKEKNYGKKAKAVKDEDQILSDSDSSLHGIDCDICDMNFSSLKTYETHMQGKKHQKMVAQAKFISKHMSKKEEIDNKSESDDDDDDDSKEIHCEVCNKYFSGHISYLGHLKGSSHAKNKKKLKLKQQMMGMPEVLDSGNKGENSDDDGILQKPFARCSTCQKEFSGPEPFRSHMKSAVHKKKVQQSKTLVGLKSKYQDETNNSENDEPFGSCKVCQKAFSGPVPYQIHMESSVHKKNLEKVKVAAEIKEFCSNDDLEAGYVCKECKKTFTDPVGFKYHLTNNSHEKQKAKNALLEFLTLHPEIVFVTPFEELNADDENDSDATNQDYYLICKICHFSFSGPESAQDHVKSKKHVNIKTEKKMLKLLKEKKQSRSLNANDKDVPQNSSTVENTIMKDGKPTDDKDKNSEKLSIDDFEMI